MYNLRQCIPVTEVMFVYLSIVYVHQYLQCTPMYTDDKGMLVYISIVHVHQYVQCTPMYTDDRGHVCVHIYCLCTPMYTDDRGHVCVHIQCLCTPICTMYASVHRCTPMTEGTFVYIYIVYLHQYVQCTPMYTGVHR